ncbi:hypothetical protein Ahy_A09g043461 isoform B [Arachis hypogaea]|uniref:Glucose-6-phosphate dehydrogenase NAD-binding domain-containing protein n=1 Tax=Arachis hypogaea TaxID=3818 RepID=A0A445BID2_ARAHY|nr:hypothetical protein Ahy_A09g043461 isoform B [Arachis hypogaea]
MRMNEWHIERRSSFEIEYPLARESSNVSETGSLSIVVLGASGDLAKKKMFLTLFHLYRQRGFKALCCSSCRSISISSIEKAESSSVSDWLPLVSSVAQVMVQERLEQLDMKRRLEERCRRKQQNRVRERTKFVVMVAIEKCSYDPREDFREFMWR